MDFKAQLQAYKTVIDQDIATYAQHVASSTNAQYGAYPSDVTSVFLDVLGRGGKRIRGALAMVGYEMCGGQDQQMIVRAATALEMINAYILMVDDVQDRSVMRRGKATAHEMLADYHRDRQLKGDAAHTGVSLALNAALAGSHAAQMLLAGLSVDAELRVKAIGIINLAMVVTAHGQTQDIMNELVDRPSLDDLEHVLEWKTAYYTFLNPLCVGMVLAGAGCEDTDAIRDYALHTGRAFQITDDIIGVFGDDKQTGKNAMDDIREGKQTLLTDYAFDHITDDDAAFLRAMLGNESLTTDEFARCKTIIESSGALDNAREAARHHIRTALTALDTHAERWSPAGVGFLRDLAGSLLDRSA
ncbi:MAG TPA: polyprenyl synthetase family protein [Candidatus Saccharimonadales bacterium]|nr:polyprenyl synthetase family protein [Candidatus Saccharimonadales bacterium]